MDILISLLEFDSMLVANMVTKENTSNLKLKQILGNIINYKKRAGIQMNHCYREETK